MELLLESIKLGIIGSAGATSFIYAFLWVTARWH